MLLTANTFGSGMTDQPLVGGAADHELYVSQLYPRNHAATQVGRVYSSTTTPLGLAIPIYTTTAPVGNVLWNTSSNMKAILLDYTFAYVSGAGVNGAFLLFMRNGVGQAIGTPITAFATTVPNGGKGGPVNGVAGVGGQQATTMSPSNAGTVTLASAGVAGEAIQVLGGQNQPLSASAQGTGVFPPCTYNFDGSVEVFPGSVIWVASNVASVGLYAQTIRWMEVPV